MMATIARALGNGINVAEVLSGKVDDLLGRIDSITEAVDFDTFWGLAEELLHGATIKPDLNNLLEIIQIEDLNTTNYYDERPEERYIATFYAIRANYPKSFSRVISKAKDFARKQDQKTMKSQTPSTPEPSKPVQSPSSTPSIPE
jgi:hypothetical protein